MRVMAIVGLVLGLMLEACSSDSGTASGDQHDRHDAGSRKDGAVDAGAPDAEHDAGQVSCDVEAPRACIEPKPVYDEVSPILKERCVMCHNGAAGGPWPLTSYGHVADWQNEIRDQVSRCTMPPADAGVPITNEERAKILMWIRCGMQR